MNMRLILSIALLSCTAWACQPSKKPVAKPSTRPSTANTAKPAPVNVLAEGSYNTVAQKFAFYEALSQRYNIDAVQIINAEQDPKAVVSYADGNTRKDLIDEYGTVVHEACHGYNFRIGGFDSQGYYITGNVKIEAPESEVFNSNALNSVVPKAVQDKIFRYDTYVGSASGVSSQVRGIFGMLNEFSAYYHGTKAQLGLFDYYQSLCKSPDQYCWEPYLSNVASEVHAYHEFRLFMAWYLGYAKKNKPAVYQSLMANKPLRVAYTLLDQLYAQTVADYFAKRKKVMDVFAAAGQTVKVEEGFIRFYTKGGGGYSGFSVPDDTIAYLEGLLKPEDKAVLDAFAVQGATLQNYEAMMK